MSNYQPQQGRRFSLINEGVTALTQDSTGSMVLISQAGLANLDTHDPNARLLFESFTPSLWLIFPEYRDIYALHLEAGWANYNGFFNPLTAAAVTTALAATSSDTTSGADGTWSQAEYSGLTPSLPYPSTASTAAGDVVAGPASFTSYTTAAFPTQPDYRASVVPLVGQTQAVRAIRFDFSWPNPGQTAWAFAIQTLHLYGRVSANQNPTCLLPWHPTLEQSITMADLDLGDVPTSTSYVRSMRFRNADAALTAHSVTVAASGGSPTLLSNHGLSDVGTFREDLRGVPSAGTQGSALGEGVNASESFSVRRLDVTLPTPVSLDGTTWLPSVSLGDVTPGTDSPVVYVQRNVDASAQYGAFTTAVQATVASWS